MPEPEIAPYGSWRSPITSDLIVAESIRLDQVVLDGEDVYWTESRPREGGRYFVVRRAPDGTVSDVTTREWNVRTRVHEYGGAAFTVREGVLYFSNFADQRLYRQEPGGTPEPLTPDAPLRFADAVVDTARNRLVCVCEDHSRGGQQPDSYLVSVPLDGCGAPATLASGHDFYSNPRISPDGTRLSWLTWDHPNMPWLGTDLWVANVQADGSLGEPEHLAGSTHESIFQPDWSPDGTLHFVSDRSGWWNLYRLGSAGPEPLAPREAEFGQAQWVFGQATYGFADGGRVVCSYSQDGFTHLATLGPSTGELRPVALPYTSLGGLRVGGGQAAFLAGSPSEPTTVVRLDLATGQHEALRTALRVPEELRAYFTTPRSIEFPTEDGKTAHALFYPPCNPDFQAPEGERPPLVVHSHGGPTSSASSVLSLSTQYWTSRGFGVVDVNYGGSTGYGREYMLRLQGTWGIVDMDDCVNAALYLVESGEADRERLAISGGSAGGYTTLCALTFRDVFKTGASYFGVSDLGALARETHKFESRYLDGLIGPYPEAEELYRERSPIFHPERLKVPIAFFQGAEDAIVLPNQAELMVDALRSRGIPYLYMLFEGEQHGFRKAENIQRSLDGELYFYATVMLRAGLRF